MSILHSKTVTLNRPPRIMRSENANSTLKIEILCSENANLGFKTAMVLRPRRILHSENGNSALKKWKFHAQKWKFCTQKMETFPKAMENQLFCTKSGNSMLPHSSRISTRNSAIAELRNPEGTAKYNKTLSDDSSGIRILIYKYIFPPK